MVNELNGSILNYEGQVKTSYFTCFHLYVALPMVIAYSRHLSIYPFVIQSVCSFSFGNQPSIVYFSIISHCMIFSFLLLLRIRVLIFLFSSAFSC